MTIIFVVYYTRKYLNSNLERFTTDITVLHIVNIAIRKVPALGSNLPRSQLDSQMDLRSGVGDKIIFNLCIAAIA